MVVDVDASRLQCARRVKIANMFITEHVVYPTRSFQSIALHFEGFEMFWFCLENGVSTPHRGGLDMVLSFEERQSHIFYPFSDGTKRATDSRSVEFNSNIRKPSVEHYRWGGRVFLSIYIRAMALG